jgi:hypothetical protein
MGTIEKSVCVLVSIWMAAGGMAWSAAHGGAIDPLDRVRLTPASQQTVRAQPQAKQPATESPRATMNRKALLIGIGEARYRGIKQTPLPQCVVDAKTLSATLTPRGYACQVVADGEAINPTAAKIREQISALCVSAGEKDQLLIYISTHGDVIDGKSVVIAKDDAVEVDWVKQQLSASKAAVKVLMLDCCRNNKGFESTATEVRDVHCIMACRPDQLSQVGQSGMSVFTEAMVDGLLECRADRVKDGKIELDELMYFLDREVPLRAAKVDAAVPQNPTKTVVDPKVVAPVFAECTLFDQLTFGPSTYAGLPPGTPRTSLALSSFAFFTLRAGLAPQEVVKAVKAEWTQAPVLDEKGAGMGLIEGKPTADDVLVVRFERGGVSVAHVLYRNMCKEQYSSLQVRGAISNLIGEGALVLLAEKFAGHSPANIMKKLGCPESALLPTGQFTQTIGELRYPEAPRPGQMLIVRVKEDKFDSVDIAPIE